MIDASELRVGNLYYLGLTGTKDIQEFNNWTQALEFEGYGYPIELTEEILLMCEFIFHKAEFYTKDDILSFIFTDKGKLQQTFYCGDKPFRQIFYLHDLQNTYRFLTGVELNTSKLLINK